MPLIDTAAQQAGLQAIFANPADLTLVGSSKAFNSLEPCAIIFILNFDSASAMTISQWLVDTAVRHPKRLIIPLDARGVHAEFEKRNLLTQDEAVQKYWRANGATNIRRLFDYTKAKYLGLPANVEPPIMIPDYGYYDPEHEDALADFASYRDFKRSRGRWAEGAPVVALLIQQSFWITHDTKVIDVQLRALEARGLNPVAIFGDRQSMVEKLIRDTKPDALIEDRHGAMWDSRQVLQDLDVPYLRPISMLASTIEEWKRDPRGMSHRDVGLFMAVQESWGTLEPIVVGGMQTDISGFHLHDPILDRVARFAERTASWLSLRGKPNSEKKIAIVYYNKDLGKDDLMRGSPTGAFLDAPESAVRFLPRMREAGYRFDRLPSNGPQLIQWIKQSGRNIGPWNQAKLEDMVNSGATALVPLAKYERWFREKLSPAKQAEMLKAYGPPPGKLMVVRRQGQPYIVIPQVKLGNVILLPQPERGEAQDDTLLHSRDVPPPHNYLAFYWWLQEEFHADAVVHWGTHGSLEMLPGKEAGLTGEDWGDVCVGRMPIIDLWIMDNLAEAILARRRSYAAIVDHMVPPAFEGGTAASYKAIRSDLMKFQSLEAGLLKERYRKLISEEVIANGLPSRMGLKSDAVGFGDADLDKIGTRLDELTEEQATVGLHVLGSGVTPEDEVPYIVTILGLKFLEHLAELKGPAAISPVHHGDVREKAIQYLQNMLAEHTSPLLAETVDLQKDVEFAREIQRRLRGADAEITGLLRALDGRYVTPGPGPDPIRNPDSIPGGRNLYALNPEEIPTRAAWEVGKQLVNEFLKTHHPKKVAFDLNGMDTMRDFGVVESQVLYLLGVRPVWDRNNLAIDVEVIRRSELKRPRIDVFLAMGGQYKENFTTRVHLMDKAVKLISSLEEDENYVRLGTERVRARLLADGTAPEKAEALSSARIFGSKPGNVSGTNILYLIPRSGVWKQDDEVADVYVDNMSYAYTGDIWGEKVNGLYKEAIQNTDAVIRVWASNMTSQLSNHHAYEYLGGLSMAITKLTGHEPEAYIADVRNPDGVRMREFGEVLTSNLDTELLSREWILQMKAHGYAGAGHAAELVKNTFGWSVTRQSSVSGAEWDDIYHVYVQDKFQLGVRTWMENDNAYAMEEIAATMLEASRKQYWKATPQQVGTLASLYASLVVKHGDSGGLVSGGNSGLENYVTSVLKSNPGVRSRSLAIHYTNILHRVPAPGKGISSGSAPVLHARAASASAHRVAGAARSIAGVRVSGQRMSPIPVMVFAYPLLVLTVAGWALLITIFGFLTRKGVIA
jgi:cobaltochelatase CobN